MATSVETERKLFRLIADPIKNYLMEQGFDELSAGITAANMAQRVHDNIKNNVEISSKKA